MWPICDIIIIIIIIIITAAIQQIVRSPIESDTCTYILMHQSFVTIAHQSWEQSLHLQFASFLCREKKPDFCLRDKKEWKNTTECRGKTAVDLKADCLRSSGLIAGNCWMKSQSSYYFPGGLREAVVTNDWCI